MADDNISGVNPPSLSLPPLSHHPQLEIRVEEVGVCLHMEVEVTAGSRFKECMVSMIYCWLIYSAKNGT